MWSVAGLAGSRNRYVDTSIVVQVHRYQISHEIFKKKIIIIIHTHTATSNSTKCLKREKIKK